MTDSIATRTVVVCNEQGLHARPAHLFAKLADEFSSEIVVIKGSMKVDGKSVLEVLTLGAPKDTELTLQATGQDAQAAVDALAELLEQQTSEPEQVDQNP